MPGATSPGRDSILRNLGLPTSKEGIPKIPEIPKDSGLSLLLSIQFLIYIGWSVFGCGPQLLGHFEMKFLSQTQVIEFEARIYRLRPTCRARLEICRIYATDFLHEIEIKNEI